MEAAVEEIADRLVEAFNSRDLGAVPDLVHEAVEFRFGPKTLGREEFKEFIERQLFGVALRVTHGRRFRRGDELVAECRQELRYVDGDELASIEDRAALYVARDGRLIQYVEFPDLASALARSSVTEDDEIHSH